MYKSSFLLIIILTLILTPLNTFAWGEKGHAMIAEVAFSYLDANTKKIVINYLDGMSIEDAANWMDNIKSDHRYDFMKPYHYVNFNKGTEVFERSGGNIIYILNITIKELQNKKKLSKEEIKTKILIIFHLIGDLHQPLHIGYGSDKGGNAMQINYRDRGTNLHAFWDSGIIEYKGITLQECLDSNNFSKKEINKLQEMNVVIWSQESRYLLDQIYNTEGSKISEDYVNTNAALIETQILKGGIRLASILTEIFHNSNT